MRGLVLEGGGSRGAFQVGALYALQELGIEFDGVVGSSIGALNSAMYIQEGVDGLIKLWESLDSKDIFGEGFAKISDEKFTFDNLFKNKEVIINLLSNKGLDTSLLRQYINKNIDEEKIRKSGKDLGLVTFNLSKFKAEKVFLEDIKEGELPSYLMASAYLPGFKQEEINGQYFLDGGIIDNMPYSMLVDKGYDEFIIIRINGVGVITQPSDDLNYIMITPRKSVGTGIDFSHENIMDLINRGYLDTCVQMGMASGIKYTIGGDLTEFAFNLFNKNEASYKRVAELLNEEGIKTLDQFYIYLLPKIVSYLGLKKKETAGQIALHMAETAMEYYEMDTDVFYDFKDLAEIMLEKEKNYTDDSSFLERLIEDKNKVITKIFMELIR